MTVWSRPVAPCNGTLYVVCTTCNVWSSHIVADWPSIGMVVNPARDQR